MDSVTFGLIVVFAFMFCTFILGVIFSPKIMDSIWNKNDRKALKKWLKKMNAVSHGYQKGAYCIFNKNGCVVAQFIKNDNGKLYLQSTSTQPPKRIYSKINLNRLNQYLKQLPNPEDI